MMRALTGLLVIGAIAVSFPAAAHADGSLCPTSTGGDYSYQARLTPLISQQGRTVAGPATEYFGGEAGLAARSVLGDQFVMLWPDTPRQGWSVAFSPGTHDAASAREAIRATVAPQLSAADTEYVMNALLLVPTPYSLAELNAAQADASAKFTTMPGVPFLIGIDCRMDAVRVRVGIGATETPELRAVADALTATHGDKVHIEFDLKYAIPLNGTTHDRVALLPEAQPNLPVQQRPTLRVRDHASLPKPAKCVRGVLTVKPGTDVARIKLAVGQRKVFARAGKAARLKLKSRRTKVTVAVSLKDGGTATETFTYRRCA